MVLSQERMPLNISLFRILFRSRIGQLKLQLLKISWVTNIEFLVFFSFMYIVCFFIHLYRTRFQKLYLNPKFVSV